MITTILIVLLAIGMLACLLPGIYLLLLTAASFFYKPVTGVRPSPSTRFAILIPAHNEEILLPKLLENLRALVYPQDMFDIYVVADNCSDSTADVARSWGASAFERHDEEDVGKGYALRWLLEQLAAKPRDHDAYLILDADSMVSSNFLSVMDNMFQSGSSVVQSYYTVSNPTQSPVSGLRYIALMLMHYVRPRGRQVLGLSCGLFGTGMAFKREILDAYGWGAFTLAEDVEYFLELTDRGVKVDFAPEATHWAQMPATLSDAKSQNLRWERGRLQMAWRYGFRFLTEGVIRGDLVRIDAAIEQLIPPLSIIFAASLALLLLSLATGSLWLIALGMFTLVVLLSHLFVGLIVAKAPMTAYRAFAFAPWFIMWKVLVYAQAFMPGRMGWTRTKRF